ncbi:ketopantoate reductase family protein [Thalassospira lucentensis]|uniref:ketopantoate reductase family protein n=1 Tax=Thalassospira lucentensis TaxID=168935 RepID=UPI0003B46C09|nr:2-dehydropantoate 2-reductase [Thalassospira lucentensis]RCK30617.1 2-dehydropantoate 2-reductase [Thalassospira lucentensis MCCC 1A00383 = DSM 14000]
MKIAVMGAGAVGCYYGAMLARAGHDVTLIGRPTHVEVMNRDGLLLDLGASQEYVAVTGSTEASSVAGAELILLCVKSTDTEDAGQQIKPFIGKDTIILSLQNGVDNAERLGQVLGQPVIPVVVYVATSMGGAGHVKHHGRGELVIGMSSQSQVVADTLRPARIPVEISENADGALWAKMILNCAYNALSAITQTPYGELVKQDGIWDVIRNAVDECLAVAAACGVTIPGDVWGAIEKIVETMPAQFSSTAQDLARGKPTEIDYLNGYIVRKGCEFGIATPTNLALHSITKLQERRA